MRIFHNEASRTRLQKTKTRPRWTKTRGTKCVARMMNWYKGSFISDPGPSIGRPGCSHRANPSRSQAVQLFMWQYIFFSNLPTVTIQYTNSHVTHKFFNVLDSTAAFFSSAVLRTVRRRNYHIIHYHYIVSVPPNISYSENVSSGYKVIIKWFLQSGNVMLQSERFIYDWYHFDVWNSN